MYIYTHLWIKKRMHLYVQESQYTQCAYDIKLGKHF